MKTNKTVIKSIIYIFLLVLLDQVSKVIAYTYLIDCDTYFIPNFFGIRVVLNKDDLSYLNRVMDLSVPLSVLLILNLLIVIAIPFIYKSLKDKGRMEYTAFIFVFAGCFSSFLDKLIYKGSWDFIIFYKWIIDFKDIYITVFEVIVVLCLIKGFIKVIKQCKRRRHTRKRE